MEQQLLGTPGVLLLTFIGTECKSRRWKHAVSAVWHCVYCAASYGNASRLQKKGACHQEVPDRKTTFSKKVVSTLRLLLLLLLFPFFFFIPPSIRGGSNNHCWTEKKNSSERAISPSVANVWLELEITEGKTGDLLVIDMLADEFPPGFRTLEKSCYSLLLEVCCIVWERPAACRLTALRRLSGGRAHRK